MCALGEGAIGRRKRERRFCNVKKGTAGTPTRVTREEGGGTALAKSIPQLEEHSLFKEKIRMGSESLNKATDLRTR